MQTTRTKRVIEIIVLASFTELLLLNNTHTYQVITNEHMAYTTNDIEILPILTSTEIIEDDIKTEIFYGEVEEVALLVHHEAGNQDELGQRYVADVVWNRVEDPRFPDSIHAVINQKNPTQFVDSDRLEDCGYAVQEENFRIALEEYFNRTDREVIYFSSTDYIPNTTPLFKHGDHYFSK